MDDEREVYVVTDGDYSEYHIVAVFDDRDLADKWVSLRKMATEYFDGRIETFALNPILAQTELVRGPVWECAVTSRNDGMRCSPQSLIDAPGEFAPKFIDDRRSPGWWMWKVGVFAMDQETAIKIAAEKIAQAKAEREGIA
jgi:hypothetical protein